MGGDRKKVSEKVKPTRYPVIIILGSTGVGKTHVAFELAKMCNGEIVSADSRLVYKMMDIGTAKPDKRMQREVPHHLIDVVMPDEQYTCKRFEIEARQKIEEILQRHRVAIVVGGSGLYVRALVDGIFEGAGSSAEIRDRLRHLARQHGTRYLWEKLRHLDPEKARKIDPNNTIRIIRALEVCELSGKPMSEIEQRRSPLSRPYLKVGLTRQRKELYTLIEERVDRMIKTGFLDEVRTLIDMGFASAPAVQNTLGYKHLLLHLQGSLSLEDAIRLIKRDTRRFAKRQMTWFRKERNVHWLDITGEADHRKIAERIYKRWLAS